jgi:hypothetical protein
MLWAISSVDLQDPNKPLRKVGLERMQETSSGQTITLVGYNIDLFSRV